jgi:putative SOS response-associated peptidase YedK
LGERVEPKTKPINATAERVASAPMFKSAYAKRRCIVPVNGFFEWKAIKGAKAKQPFAIGMSDGRPFGLAGVWENWKHPETQEWLRTFCIITTTANELVGQIHDRVPVIIPAKSYDRWLANIEPDPRDLLVPYPSELMRMWPISTRMNKPDNDDPSILDPVEAANPHSYRRSRELTVPRNTKLVLGLHIASWALFRKATHARTFEASTTYGCLHRGDVGSCPRERCVRRCESSWRDDGRLRAHEPPKIED